jgi:hypothetical protein
MKTLVPVLSVMLTASAAFAQFHGYGSGGATNTRGYGSFSGFGSVLFPGTGHAPPVGPVGGFGYGAYGYGAHGGRYGGGYGGTRWAPLPPASGMGYRSFNTRAAVVPYPVFVGGSYGGYYDGLQPVVPEPQQPQTIVIQQPPAQVAAGNSTPVIINQYFRSDATPAEAEQAAESAVRQYRGTGMVGPPASAAPSQVRVLGAQGGTEDKATIYLIALRDHTIMPSLGYWVEGDTLNYITAQGSHNRVSMDLVDKSFSRQLNDERRVEFNLP